MHHQDDMSQQELEEISQSPMQNDLSMAEKQDLMQMNQQIHIPHQFQQQLPRYEPMGPGPRGMPFSMGTSHTTGKKGQGNWPPRQHVMGHNIHGYDGNYNPMHMGPMEYQN